MCCIRQQNKSYKPWRMYKHLWSDWMHRVHYEKNKHAPSCIFLAVFGALSMKFMPCSIPIPISLLLCRNRKGRLQCGMTCYYLNLPVSWWHNTHINMYKKSALTLPVRAHSAHPNYCTSNCTQISFMQFYKYYGNRISNSQCDAYSANFIEVRGCDCSWF